MATEKSSKVPTQGRLLRPVRTAFQFAAKRLGFRTGGMDARSAQGCGLGIDHLPDGLDQLSTGIPAALVLQHQASQYIWLRALLKDALTVGPVFLLAEDSEWVDRLLDVDFLRKAHTPDQLTIMLMSPQINDQIKKHGIDQVLSELEEGGLKEDHTLFTVGSHHWLYSLRAPELHQLARTLHRWCSKRSHPVTFIFTNPADPNELLTRLRNQFGLFPHIAMLANGVDRPLLLLERWSSSKGAVFQSRYGLRKDETSSRLTYDGSLTSGQAQELIEAPDQFEVIATQAAIAGQRGIPSHWKILNQAGAGAAAVTSSIAATVLLHAGAASDFETLARVVHHLRLSHPRTLKIVIRETQGKLRANTEQALLHLGANLVIYKEVGFSRLLQMIQDINAQTFTKEVNPDYEKALASFTPDTIRGYLTPTKFCASVQAVLERTSGIGSKHTLVQLHMLPLLPHLDALHACTMLRDGDLLTADSDSLFVFLFACQEHDVDQALGRLFSLPLAQLFSSQVTDSSESGVQIMLAKLNNAARQGLPDYSRYLDAPSTKPTAVATPSQPDDSLAILKATPTALPSTDVVAGIDTTAPTVRPSPVAKRHVTISHH